MGRPRKDGTPAAKPGEKEAVVKVASTKGVGSDREKALLDEIKALQAKLQVAEEKRTEAEENALKLAESQGMLMQREIHEVPTGKFVTVKRLDKMKVVGYKDDGREINKPVFKSVELPTFFYKIDLPPSGGVDVKINEVPLYHGGVYELDIDTLRTVKDIVYRCWAHDASIHGNNENAYRRPQRPVLSGRSAFA